MEHLRRDFPHTRRLQLEKWNLSFEPIFHLIHRKNFRVKYCVLNKSPTFSHNSHSKAQVEQTSFCNTFFALACTIKATFQAQMWMALISVLHFLALPLSITLCGRSPTIDNCTSSMGENYCKSVICTACLVSMICSLRSP